MPLQIVVIPRKSSRLHGGPAGAAGGAIATMVVVPAVADVGGGAAGTGAGGIDAHPTTKGKANANASPARIISFSRELHMNMAERTL